MKITLLLKWCFCMLVLLWAPSVSFSGRVKKALDDRELSKLEEIDLDSDAPPTTEELLAAEEGNSGGEHQLTRVIEQTSLFQKDAIDLSSLQSMDCHMRNLDFCYAGLLATAQRMLPETDDEFEVRCDEMKAASACLAKFNQRCATFKVFAMIAPTLSGGGGGMSPASSLPASQRDALNGIELPKALEETLVYNSESGNSSSSKQVAIRLEDLMNICEPAAKQSRANRILRQRLFQLAKCVNERLPLMRPCVEDLKAALQLFYEPRRVLPMKPSCCAMGRFRQCAQQALDRVCGLSSFDQLEQTLTSSGGSGMNMLKLVDRVCGKEAARFDSSYCLEVLPPSGMKLTPKRGSKASKLARALDMISFAPAAQQQW